MCQSLGGAFSLYLSLSQRQKSSVYCFRVQVGLLFLPSPTTELCPAFPEWLKAFVCVSIELGRVEIGFILLPQ